MVEFEASKLDHKHPPQQSQPGRTRRDRFIPFLQFPPMLCKIIHTTTIESLNYQLRKITKNRGHSLLNSPLPTPTGSTPTHDNPAYTDRMTGPRTGGFCGRSRRSPGRCLCRVQFSVSPL